MNWVRLNEQVRSDCEELLARFQQTDSVRFDVFSKIWKEMKFGQIFYGTVGREKRAFSQLVLDVAVGYFMPPFSFQIRVGGLYLIYSLYHCQTASPRVGISVALKDWDDVLSLEKDALGSRHLDAVYVLRQLLSCKAFRFTAMPTSLKFKKSRKAEGSRLRDKFVARARAPQELLDRDAMEELANVHDLYHKLKLSVCAESSEGKRSGMDLIRPNIVQKLRGCVLTFNDWQSNNQLEADDNNEEGGGGGGGDVDGGQGTSLRTESSQRARLLSSIKSRAYGQATESCKSRRHRQVELDVGDRAGPASPKKAAKVSLKARTQENLCTVAALKKEAPTVTRIHRLVTLERCKFQGKQEENNSMTTGLE
ncbi:snRNA-activating protein complex subunit 1-like isoform X2 [Stigmatopora nigra]